MSSVCIYGKDFHEMHTRLRGPSNLLILHQIINIEPDFSCLAGELAEQRPDIYIKVTAFTVSEKSINTWSGDSGQKSIQCKYYSL